MPFPSLMHLLIFLRGFVLFYAGRSVTGRVEAVETSNDILLAEKLLPPV
jgi:hypothetical protein